MSTTINTRILQKHLEIVNAERAVAVKALQEIEDYLCAPKNDYQAIVKAFLTASVALEELGEESL